ncbi:UNVERIFIED_CONTAM: hypothetical protein GTU68_057229 [Idotea baltica]|nr:hypothetical protein [Idotea baltica]
MAEWDLRNIKNTSLNQEPERAVLIGAILQHQTEQQVIEYLDELEFLALTAGAKTIERFTQKLPHPDTTSFIRKGKVEEIGIYIEEHDIDVVIFDDDLTGKQTSFLEETYKRKIIDRSTLILDIFASRARTSQARTQVELAQLQYMLPRLRGLWTHLERQRGGIGMRGPGEKEIETDRRIVRDKISLLKEKLKKIEQQGAVQRKNRGEMIRVALVGYTNVGKSTLMNVLSKSEVFAENKLFATLDTTVRKVVIDRTPFLLSDTVGFIRKLPHHLIESFKSTLDEVKESDFHVHVVDIANPQYEDQIEVVQKTMADMEANEVPSILVFNKIDKYRKDNYDDFLDQETQSNIEAELIENMKNKYQCDVLFISALTKEHLDDFRIYIIDKVRKLYQVRYPYRSYHW